MKSGNSIIRWNHIARPDEENKLSSFDLSKGSGDRYVICCLKDANRLAALLQWLNSDRKQKKNLRILLIDDEADQAGVNSKNMKKDPEDRSIINKLVMDIVNNTNNVSKYKNRQIKVYTDIPYGAMNYVAYTATPYANVLNESGPESLYPRDFITGLIASDLYLGPQQIFGETVNNKNAGMPIINEICGDNRRGKEEASGDLALLDEVCAGETGELPHSLHEAIAWFYCAAAARRLALTRKLTTSDSTKLDPEKVHPVSMLIHHNRATNTH